MYDRVYDLVTQLPLLLPLLYVEYLRELLPGIMLWFLD